MKLSNYHNQACKNLIEPAITEIKKYDWDKLQEIIYPLFNATKTGNVDLWYTLILMEDDGKLFFGFTQENNKAKIGTTIHYNDKKLKVKKLGMAHGYHGWCKLAIVECTT